MHARLEPEALSRLIKAARGHQDCDLLIRGAFVVNVFTDDILRADVGVAEGRVAVVTDVPDSISASRVIDADGLFLTPGLIDGHMHLESTMLSPAQFARAVLAHGTTAAVLDPHEIANVAGRDGIRELVEACDGLPFRFLFTAPPAVPASRFEQSNGVITPDDMAELIKDPRFVGIGEAMDYPGVIAARPDVLAKLGVSGEKTIDGHAPGLQGRDLQAYIAAGPNSDHECSDEWEALEKLRAGMYLMIREGSAARNLDALIKLADVQTASRCLLVTDDLSPADLVEVGHLNHLLARAVRRGVTAPQAVRMATINAAQRFKLDGLGAIAPGYHADIAAFEDLSEFRAAFVVQDGRLVVSDGEIAADLPRRSFGSSLTHSVSVPRLDAEALEIPAGSGPARVIEARDSDIVTGSMLIRPCVIGGHVVADTGSDVLKIVVVERHGGSGDIGLGLVTGFGLTNGAMAGSVAHDAHNVIAVGANDADILRAVGRVGEMNGGLVVAAGGAIVGELPLPIGGLMSEDSAESVAATLICLEDAARELGCPMAHPFMTLSFMALSVVPELKITASGLVDVGAFELVPLFTGQQLNNARKAG
jgi:adenine deaminase